MSPGPNMFDYKCFLRSLENNFFLFEILIRGIELYDTVPVARLEPYNTAPVTQSSCQAVAVFIGHCFVTIFPSCFAPPLMFALRVSCLIIYFQNQRQCVGAVQGVDVAPCVTESIP